MEQHLLSYGPLLDESGQLCEAGYAFSLVKTYDRKAIKAGKSRIKEWDYYLIYNDRFGVALTLDDNSYMGMLSASFLDFEKPSERTFSPMFWLPFGKTGFPASSTTGDVAIRLKGAAGSYTHEDGKRHLVFRIDNFQDGKPFSCDLWLSDEPRDSMVIATPFPNKPTAFYYNQKNIGMRAEGTVEYRANGIRFPRPTASVCSTGDAAYGRTTTHGTGARRRARWTDIRSASISATASGTRAPQAKICSFGTASRISSTGSRSRSRKRTAGTITFRHGALQTTRTDWI